MQRNYYLKNEIKIGAAGEHLTICDILLQGYKCFKVEDQLPFDIVMFDTRNKMYKIQVKSTLNRKRNYHTKNKISYCFSVIRQKRVRTKIKEKEGYTYHHQENKYTKDDYDILALVVIPLKKVFYYRFKDIKLKYISLKGDEKQHLYKCLDNPIIDKKLIKKIKRCY